MIYHGTEQAMAYVALERRRCERSTWFDVAKAYDAGLRSGVEARAIAKKQLRELTQARPITREKT